MSMNASVMSLGKLMNGRNSLPFIDSSWQSCVFSGGI